MNRINFLPDRIRRKRLSARQLRRNGVLLVLVACVLGGVSMIGQLRIARAAEQLDGYEMQLDNLARQLEVIPELQKKLSDAQIKSRISSEVGSNVSTMQLMAEITNLLPENSCISSLEFDAVETNPVVDSKRKSAIKKNQQIATIRRVVAKITGLAPTNMDLAEFMVGLSNSPVFEEVKMGYSRIVPVSGQNRLACEFEVTCFVTH